MRKFFILIPILAISLSCTFTPSDNNANKFGEVSDLKCDTVSILDSIVHEILFNPKIRGYSRYATSNYDIILPNDYVRFGEKFREDNVGVKFYGEDQTLSTTLNPGDVIFKTIEFKNDFSVLNSTVLFIGDKGDEAMESSYTYSVDIDNCKWNMEESNHIIIN